MDLGPAASALAEECLNWPNALTLQRRVRGLGEEPAYCSPETVRQSWLPQKNFLFQQLSWSPTQKLPYLFYTYKPVEDWKEAPDALHVPCVWDSSVFHLILSRDSAVSRESWPFISKSCLDWRFNSCCIEEGQDMPPCVGQMSNSNGAALFTKAGHTPQWPVRTQESRWGRGGLPRAGANSL